MFLMRISFFSRLGSLQLTAAPTPLVLPSDSVLRINHRMGDYVPRLDAANALGNVTVFSVRAPRTLISIARGDDDDEGEDSGTPGVDAASRAERVQQSRKKALARIERAFTAVMQVRTQKKKKAEFFIFSFHNIHWFVFFNFFSQVEDIDLRAATLRPEERREIFNTRQALLQQALDELSITADANSDEDPKEIVRREDLPCEFC